jgi:hypothetical protein
MDQNDKNHSLDINSCAAWGEKLTEIEPSTRFGVRGAEDITYLLIIIRNYPHYHIQIADFFEKSGIFCSFLFNKEINS